MYRVLRERQHTQQQPAGAAPIRPVSGRVRQGRRGAVRRGAVTLWTVLCLPVVLSVLVVMVEVSHLWQARVELENALEAGVLAAVKEWGDQGGGAKSIRTARAVGNAYTKANTIHDVQVDLDDESVATSVKWCFGSAARCRTGFDFQHAPEATAELAVVLQATAKVHRLLRPLGPFIGEPTVTAKVVAFYDCSSKHHRPQLIRLN